jgi:hypothetical protein
LPNRKFLEEREGISDVLFDLNITRQKTAARTFLKKVLFGFLLHESMQAVVILKVNMSFSDSLTGEIHSPIWLNTWREKRVTFVWGEISDRP